MIMPITVSLGKELEDRLNRLSDVTRRSKSLYVKEAVQEYLNKMESTLMATAFPATNVQQQNEENSKPDKT